MVRQQGVYKKIPLQYISQNLEPSKIKIEGLRIWLSNNFWSDSFEPSFSVFRGNIVVNKPKSRISKHVFQENKARQIFQKTIISYPVICTHTCTYQGVRNVRFLENLACFIFLNHPFSDSSFCLITNELKWESKKFFHIVVSLNFILFLD